MTMPLDLATNFAAIAPPLAALAAGVISAALYGRKRKWVNALLIGVGAVALAVALADIRTPVQGGVAAIFTDGGAISEADLMAIQQAGSIILSGDGLREAEWRDLPARAVQWKPAAADLLWLDFPRSISLGRAFTLTVRRSQAQAGWRLQLLAENKQVLADSGAVGASVAPFAQLSVQWLPPVAETMVLQARLVDINGKTIAQGPIPLQVKDALPLQIQGRFDAPSFDARTLNQLLSDGSAILDWNVTLGKAIARSETARAPLTAPNAVFVDAAYVEHLAPSARAALLAQTGQGIPLVILGANAADASMWRREFGLALHPQSPTTEKEDIRQFSVAGASLAMPPAGLNPADNVAEPWSVLARDLRKQPWLWQRSMQQGRVVWIGVSEWHRYAISAPQALTLWWQSAMDRIALASVQKTGWQTPDPMPLPGLRSELCAQGVKPGALLRVDGVDGVAAMPMLPRDDKAEGVCAAVWPEKPGWMTFSGAGVAEPGLAYVYAKSDWPAWQKALRRDATTQYAARALPAERSPTAGRGADRPLSTMPFAVLFALCMLVLWWREQRQPAAA